MRRILLTTLVTVLAVTACAPRSVNTGTISNGSLDASPSQPPATTTTTTQPIPTWGQRHTWPDGLAVEIATPKSCVPSKNAFPSGVKRAVIIKITVINGTNKPFDVTALSIGDDVQFAGRPVETVADSGGPCKAAHFVTGTVLPGKTFTYDTAYAVDPEKGELQVELQPGLMADKAIFVGQS